jgi:hypothetical protein
MYLPLKLFYGVGIFCFTVMFFANIGTIIVTHESMLIYDKIYSTASLLFNLMLIWLFTTLYRQAPPELPENDLKDGDLNELMEGFK